MLSPNQEQTLSSSQGECCLEAGGQGTPNNHHSVFKLLWQHAISSETLSSFCGFMPFVGLPAYKKYCPNNSQKCAFWDRLNRKKLQQKNWPVQQESKVLVVFRCQLFDDSALLLMI